MIQLFTQEEYKNSKETTKLPLQCTCCGDIFYKTKVTVRNALNPNRRESCNTCSSKCSGINKITKVKVNCLTCDNEIEKFPSQIKLFPNSFCNKSCASIYSNAHKTTGNKRSKLEIWLEEQLGILYPNLNIEYNNRSVINAELDIYIPALKLAFEINGIFHYEAIFGIDKLNKTQNNDNRKIQACIENGISFCVIDTSEFKYFKPEKAKKYLNIVTDIINDNL